jgi:ribosomal protein S12 methylthiotransferase accessory factor
VRHGTANDLRHELDLLGAEDFALFADEQYGSPGFGYERWTDDLPLWWRQGRDAITGAPVWAPAQLIHMAGQWRNEPAIGYATSNGLACGIKEAEAALSGLFEVVERDGFMLTWYNKLSLPQIDVTSSLALQHYINRHFTPTGLDVHLVDMSAFTGYRLFSPSCEVVPQSWRLSQSVRQAQQRSNGRASRRLPRPCIRELG